MLFSKMALSYLSTGLLAGEATICLTMMALHVAGLQACRCPTASAPQHLLELPLPPYRPQRAFKELVPHSSNISALIHHG